MAGQICKEQSPGCSLSRQPGVSSFLPHRFHSGPKFLQEEEQQRLQDHRSVEIAEGAWWTLEMQEQGARPRGSKPRMEVHASPGLPVPLVGVPTLRELCCKSPPMASPALPTPTIPHNPFLQMGCFLCLEHSLPMARDLNYSSSPYLVGWEMAWWRQLVSAP